MASIGILSAIDSAHLEMRRLYCLNPGGQGLAFVLKRESDLSQTRERLRGLYRTAGMPFY
jgi:hypothetical protein